MERGTAEASILTSTEGWKAMTAVYLFCTTIVVLSCWRFFGAVLRVGVAHRPSLHAAVYWRYDSAHSDLVGVA